MLVENKKYLVIALLAMQFGLNGVQAKLNLVDLVKIKVKTASIIAPTECNNYITLDQDHNVAPECSKVSKLGSLNDALQGKNSLPQSWAQEHETIVKVSKDEKNSQSCVVALQWSKDSWGDEIICFKCPTPKAIHATLNSSHLLFVMPRGSLIKDFLIANPFFTGN